MGADLPERDRPYTLREMIQLHPEWLDLPMGIYCSDGHYDFVGQAGSVYVYDAEKAYRLDGQELPKDEHPKVLVFAPN